MAVKTTTEGPRLKKKKKVSPLPYLLLLPTVILFGMFTYFPFLKTIFLSFSVTNKKGAFAKWVGIKNWIRVLSKDEFWGTVVVTLKMAAANLVFTFFIAMIFALLATKKTRWSKSYQTMFALPMAIATAPAAAIFLFFYAQHGGLLNAVFGTNVAWVREIPYAFWSVVIMSVWQHIGTSFIFLLVGFRNVPEDLVECSLLDGAGPLRRIRNILIPMASPQIFFVLFLNINTSFKTFNQIKLLTGGGPANSTKTLIYYIYENAIINGRFETACVQAIFLFAMIFVLTRIQFMAEKRLVHYQ